MWNGARRVAYLADLRSETVVATGESGTGFKFADVGRVQRCFDRYDIHAVHAIRRSSLERPLNEKAFARLAGDLHHVSLNVCWISSLVAKSGGDTWESTPCRRCR